MSSFLILASAAVRADILRGPLGGRLRMTVNDWRIGITSAPHQTVSPIGKFVTTALLGSCPHAGRDRICGRPPAHAVDRPPGNRIFAGAGDDEFFLGVKTYRARIVGIDVEIEALRRNALRRGEERGADARSPALRRDDKLVEIKRAAVDGDKADHDGIAGILFAVLFLFDVLGFGDDDFGAGRELVAPARPPPRQPLGEIKLRIGRLPGFEPQRDGGILVFGGVRAQRTSRPAHGATVCFCASCNSRNSSRCMVSLPATIWPFSKMASSPSRSLTKPPASRTRIEPAARSHGDRSRSQ